MARRLTLIVSAVLMPLFLAACSSGRSPVASTAEVARATITNQVSSSGAVSAGASEDLGFAKGGRLTSLKVKVGDQVTTGQVLARIDTYAARQVLKQQKANLAAQQAALDRIMASPTVSGAEATLSQSQVILTATRRQVSAASAADDSAIDRARAQLRAARRTEGKADDAVDAAQQACKVPGTPPATCASQVSNGELSAGLSRAGRRGGQVDPGSGRAKEEGGCRRRSGVSGDLPTECRGCAKRAQFGVLGAAPRHRPTAGACGRRRRPGPLGPEGRC